MSKKINVLTLGDHPLSPGGVARCLKDIITSLLETDKFIVTSLGGAMKHISYQPTRTQEWGDKWTIYPVDNFGTPEMIREAISQFKIDMIVFQSDPRFYDWFLMIDDEIRKNVPTIWYSIWDNGPTPWFNKGIWSSVDVQVPISKLTDQLMEQVVPWVERHRMPHCVDLNVFKPISAGERFTFKSSNQKLDKDFVLFWNNKNGGRKHGATIIECFKKFLDQTKADAVLLMHTDPHDQFGPNLLENAKMWGLENKVIFSTQKIPDEALNMLYNVADVSISISDAEGFGKCLSADAKISTPNGLIAIKDINIGDYVTTDDGTFEKVINKFERKSKYKTINVRGNIALNITDEHPILSLPHIHNKYEKYKNENIKPSWVKVSDLKKGDMVCMPKCIIEQNKFLFLNKKRNDFIIRNDYVLVPIRKISEISNDEIDVYDLTVENKHNFIANGIIVHNCMQESLAAGTPIICNLTGGLVEQITGDDGEFFGVGIKPASKAIVGSQQIPYIYEDRVNQEDVVNAMIKMYNLSNKEREELGQKGRLHCEKYFDLKIFKEFWPNLLENIHNKNGSWPNKGFKTYNLIKL